ncbi:MAG: N-acetyltransferase family protein [Lysobacteraceae bacterium]
MDPASTPLALRDITAEDLPWVLESHRDVYTREYGFDGTFVHAVEAALKAFARQRDPRRDGGWVAWDRAARVGSILCGRSDEPDSARIRLFLLTPDHRGQGLGRQMLDHALAFARSAGYRQVKVSTYTAHAAACALYRRMGFWLQASTPAHAFGRDLVEVDFRRELAG